MPLCGKAMAGIHAGRQSPNTMQPLPSSLSPVQTGIPACESSDKRCFQMSACHRSAVHIRSLDDPAGMQLAACLNTQMGLCQAYCLAQFAAFDAAFMGRQAVLPHLLQLQRLQDCSEGAVWAVGGQAQLGGGCCCRQAGCCNQPWWKAWQSV